VPQVPHPNNRTPAFVWGEGHPIRFAMADQLTQGEFATQTIMLIDSCFTQAVYGQHADKHDKHQIHLMQTLHIHNEKLTDDADLIVLQSYKLAKVELKIYIYRTTEGFWGGTNIRRGMYSIFSEGCADRNWCGGLCMVSKLMMIIIMSSIADRCIMAYTMAVNPISPVKLVQ